MSSTADYYDILRKAKTVLNLNWKINDKSCNNVIVDQTQGPRKKLHKVYHTKMLQPWVTLPDFTLIVQKLVVVTQNIENFNITSKYSLSSNK